MMKCEEFELMGLDMDRADARPEEAAAAAEHATSCPRCFASLQSWRELKQDLRVLHETTRLESAPARVEMRLKQELRTRREARLPHRTTRIAGWVLAAAAALAAAIGWAHWQKATPIATGTSEISAIPQGSPDQTEPVLLAADYDT